MRRDRWRSPTVVDGRSVPEVVVSRRVAQELWISSLPRRTIHE